MIRTLEADAKDKASQIDALNEDIAEKAAQIDALNADKSAAPVQVLKNVRRAVDGFVKDAEQFDDLTMLCMAYKGKADKGGEEA